MKISEEFITFLLEDFVEVGLQFFYFEKFIFMPKNTLVYINALFMIYKALELTVRGIIRLKEHWNDDSSYIGRTRSYKARKVSDKTFGKVF